METNQKDAQYTGNGWSQYQIYVLNQLKDHNTLLQRLMEKDTEQHVSMLLIQKELKDIRAELEDFRHAMDKVNSERDGDANRISFIEKDREIDSAVQLKTKTFWATLGAGVAGAVSLLIQVFEKIWPQIK